MNRMKKKKCRKMSTARTRKEGVKKSRPARVTYEAATAQPPRMMCEQQQHGQRV